MSRNDANILYIGIQFVPFYNSRWEAAAFEKSLTLIEDVLLEWHVEYILYDVRIKLKNGFSFYYFSKKRQFSEPSPKL